MSRRCFGLFDGPKAPDKPVSGAVRVRPPSMHSKRFSADVLRRSLALSEIGREGGSERAESGGHGGRERARGGEEGGGE